MKIALTSDEYYPVHAVILSWLQEHGHEPVLFGVFRSGSDVSWVAAAHEAAKAVASGSCDEGIFLCWTGTGISMVANKHKGIKAALCTDAQTARGARVWNHANVLALSHRLLSQDLATEILTAWFEPFDQERGSQGIAELHKLEAQLYRNEHLL